MEKSFNPMRFDGENNKPRELQKLIEQSQSWQRIVAGVLWAISMALTFAFCFTYLSPMFSGLFTPLGEKFATIAGGIVAGLWGVLTFDGGALVALYSYIYGAKTLEQMDLSWQVLVVDFAGSMVTNIAQVAFTLSGVFLTVSPLFQNSVAWLLIISTIAVFGFNLTWGVRYYLNSPQVLKAIHERDQEAAKLKMEHEKQKRENEIKAQIAQTKLENDLAILGMIDKKLGESLGGITDQVVAQESAALLQKAKTYYGLTDNLPPQSETLPPLAPSSLPPQATIAAATSPPSNLEPKIVERKKDINFPQPPQGE